MASLLEGNPFTLIEDAFWLMLEDRKDFCEMFKKANRVKLRDRRRRVPDKVSISKEDVPYITIVPSGVTPHPHNTSNSSSMMISWEIRIASGDQRPHMVQLPAIWVVYRALINWRTRMTALTWKDYAFVKDCRADSVVIGELKEDVDKEIRGWSSLWSGTTTCWFPSASLLLEGE